MPTAGPITADSAATPAALPQGGAARFWQFLRILGQVFYHQLDRTRLFTQAAALTYKTLFSLLPIFVLSLLLLSLISTGGGNNALDATVKRSLFEQLGLNRLYLTDNNGHVLENPNGTPVTFSHWIEPFIDRARDSVTSRATGLVAFGVLLYSSISLMIVIESTFNLIYGAAQPRTLLRRIMLYWCVLTLGPVGIAASILLGRLAFATAHSYAALSWAVSLGNALSGFIVSWLLILLMYRLIPDTRVKWRPAVIGSVIAALAWEVGKWGFGLYVEHAVRNSWYGSLALLPLFMLWIYLTWSVVLLGLQLTYMLQHFRTLRNSLPFWRTARATAGLADIRWVLPLAVLLCQRFGAGRTLDMYEASEALGLTPTVTGGLLVGLEKAGIIHLVRGRSYALARPPETITALDLLTAARALFHAPAGALRPGAPALAPASHALDTLEANWARFHTLLELSGSKTP